MIVVTSDTSTSIIWRYCSLEVDLRLNKMRVIMMIITVSYQLRHLLVPQLGHEKMLAGVTMYKSYMLSLNYLSRFVF